MQKAIMFLQFLCLIHSHVPILWNKRRRYNYFIKGVKSYRPVNVVKETVAESLTDIDLSTSFGVLSAANVGCLGQVRIGDPLSNIATTDGTVGLSFALSWTHKSPTCMHLDTSVGEHESLINGSTNSITVPSFHSFHAYTNSKLNHLSREGNCNFW